MKQNLARYKVPREIVFLDELPRNATGKVLKRELKDEEEEPATEVGISAPSFRVRLVRNQREGVEVWIPESSSRSSSLP